MIGSKVFLYLLTLFSLNLCTLDKSVESDLIIDAQLLNSRLVNYHNKLYSRKPAWLEYNIALSNNKDQAIDLCTYQVYLVIKSDEIGFIDSLQVSWGKGKLMPREKDTITIVDYFIDKPEKISEANWVNPHSMEYKCFESNRNELVNDAIYLNSFKVLKSRDFNFKIE